MPTTRAPTGFRRLTPDRMQVDRTAEAFSGLPEGVTPGQVLSAIKAAAPMLGLSARLRDAIDWLFTFTQPQDWQSESVPIVWPSARLQQEALGLSETQVKAINRMLIANGFITMKDSPNGKRYGVRDREGRIVEAYGFDLSPLGARYGEFLRLASEAKVERAERGRLRRRATIAGNGITQILETAREYGLEGAEWTVLADHTRQLAAEARQAERLEELALAVAGLERRQMEARQRLETLLEIPASAVPGLTNTAPKGSEYRPLYNYKSTLDPEQDTVAAFQGRPTGKAANEAKPSLQATELANLAPRLKSYLRTPRPTWPEIVDAADWVRQEIGISTQLWHNACTFMGRNRAAIAVALITTKSSSDFRTTPGGYFAGMLAKDRRGELHLEQTIWKLRRHDSPGQQDAGLRRV